MCREDNKEHEPINVFQARVYTVTDHLALKQSFVSEKEAMEVIGGLLGDERYGATYSRWTIRVIDPFLKMWKVHHLVENTKAIKGNEQEQITDKWRVTFYDMGDAKFIRKEYTEQPDHERIKKMLITSNSFYCIISIHEEGTAEGRYIITSMIVNKDFHIGIQSDYDIVAHHEESLKNQTEPLEKIYEQLFLEDAMETQQINKERAELLRQAGKEAQVQSEASED